MGNDLISRGIAVLLTLTLLLAVFTVLRDTQRAEPADPGSEPETLQPEALSSGRSTGFDEITPEETPEPSVPPEQNTETQDDIENDSGQTSESGAVEDDNGSGESTGGNSDAGNEGEDGEEITRPSIVTDLYDQLISSASLVNDEFSFYAYGAGGDSLSVRVNYRHKDDSGNGTFLTPVSGDRNYQKKLTLGTNYFTVYLKQGDETLSSRLFTIRYERERADENKPTIGSGPPDIWCSAEDWPGVLTNRSPTLLVQANNYNGGMIYENHISVYLDGVLQRNPTGHGVYEYEIYFQPTNRGDIEYHTISVLAWDDEGNSRYCVYNVTLESVDEGGEIGTATIILDATTVGQGLLDSYTYTIRQGVPASYAITEMLDELGYEYDYGGTLNIGFYLRRIYRGSINSNGTIPDALWTLVDRDGIPFTNSGDYDSLGERDYTAGSGWMYSVNGIFAGKGFSNYNLCDGDVMVVSFTLAYGKDIGGYSASGGSYGHFGSYCYKWNCEQQLLLGHDFLELERIEPTPEDDGWVEYECSRCGEHSYDTLPATGYDAPEDEPPPDGPDAPEESPAPDNPPDEPPAPYEPELPDTRDEPFPEDGD